MITARSKGPSKAIIIVINTTTITITITITIIAIIIIIIIIITIIIIILIIIVAAKTCLAPPRIPEEPPDGLALCQVAYVRTPEELTLEGEAPLPVV